MNSPSLSFSLIVFIICTVSACSDGNQQDETATASASEYSPGANWELHWADEFNGDELDESKWNRQIVQAGRFNDEWQRYTDSEENAYVKDGSLIIKAMHVGDSHGMDQYTSARLNTANKFTFRYGKVAARIKLPYSNGLWPAFWMLGANIDENGGDTPWPQSGEIDILELYGFRDDAIVEANIHYADLNDEHTSMGAVEYKLESGIFADNYHIFELEWDEEKLTWYVDGNEYVSTQITSEDRTEFHKDFFLLFNVAVGSTWAGRPDSTTVFPQKMYVDWVRVYKK